MQSGGTRSAHWWLARSHLRSGNQEAFVGLVTLISIVAVTVGVMLLNVVLSVMTGFEVDLKEKILGANAHVIVTQPGGGVQVDDEVLDKITAIEGVKAAAPFVYAEMMLVSRYGVSGAIVKGVDPTRSGAVTDTRSQITLGMSGATQSPEAQAEVYGLLGTKIPGYRGGEDDELPAIIIGREMMTQLGVMPGDPVQVVNPLGSGKSMLGLPVPSVKNYRIAGVFHSGMYEYDTKWTYVAVEDAQQLVKSGSSVTGIEISVYDIDDVERISRDLEDTLGGGFFARHWRDLNQALFEALALEKIVMGLILAMVVVVAGLLIVSNLYMLVLTKRRDIAVLRAMGASKADIRRIFIYVGMTIGAVGVSLGTILGLLLCLGLERYEWPLDTDVYLVSHLPVVIQPTDQVIVAIGALIVCFLSTVYPASKAAGLDPIEGLRYE